MTGERVSAPSPSPSPAALPERVAIPLAFLAGVGVALQAYVNGRLSGEVGSTLFASLLSFAVGLLALLLIALPRRSVTKARQQLRAAGFRPWYFIGGFGGAYLVSSSAAAAPTIGVALATVAIVAGQTSGSLAVDAAGLGPSGRQPVTGRRVAGVLLAIVAVVLSAVFGGGSGELHLGLLLLVGGAGVGVSVQQASNGRLQQASDSAVFAALVNFAIGTVVLAVLVLLAHPSGLTLSAPPWLYLGGLLGTNFVLTAAATVRVLGVLRLSLVAIAGQSAGALLLDGLDPAPGRSLSAATVVGVLLTIAAIGVSRR